MKYLKFGVFIAVICLFSCNGNAWCQTSAAKVNTVKETKLSEVSSRENDRLQIQNLIKEMLDWSESKKSIDLVPVLTDSKDSICTGFDLKKLKTNLGILKGTNFFSTQFIDNYEQIILTLSKKMSNKEFGEWSTGELPPFNFANDVDPWCDCQDVPYDTPKPWGLVEVKVINLNSEDGELYWKWGKLSAEVSPDWKDFSYKFKVKRENGKWKISYLEGFDLSESIKI